jgi:hypothetical protein
MSTISRVVRTSCHTIHLPSISDVLPQYSSHKQIRRPDTLSFYREVPNHIKVLLFLVLVLVPLRLLLSERLVCFNS